MNEYDKIIEEGLTKLGLNQRTHYVDVVMPKRQFRARRVEVLDNKREHPNREYYTSEDGNKIYFIENGYLHEERYDDDCKVQIFSFIRTTLTFGKY